MDTIKRRTVEVNGIKMHVAEKGEGPVVLFLHGFPELWYSWRHQILGLSSLGYRTIAPDLRGYGDTEAPGSVTSYTCFHLVGDVVALIDSLGVEKVFVVGHDWGAIIGWYLCLFRPDRVKAYVCLSVPFRPFLGRDPKIKTVDAFRAACGDDFYICRFQEPEKMESEFARVDTAYLFKNILTTRLTEAPIFPKGEYGNGFNPNPQETLPSWLSEQDIAYYVSKFENTGFTGAINYYRNLNINWELTAPWTGVGISNVPVKFIIGSVDLVYNFPGVKEYIHNGGFKKDVPNLEEVVVQNGVAHFNNQEAAEDVNNHIYQFINKF
ncbi:hypothetical protein HN51_027965 [Arachis hypogaea]|uniref:soluble epoxide hydrolase n=2 Tax=Arachis TaxID=3817 RepID=A0A445BKN4_ARAHY|nr:uncharacterized protein LOC107465289 [Arachis duranensis]XP_025618979.1 uncharacterized protein LOC112710791 [Arachis hypogaea]XP_057749333.1 uncharacterized protein LOC130968196 [Arachis stenosperma]QHO34412.1 Epoxide hydrolase [Arachis hypogaea]RYR39246.1 hypothetical protein Ahy_A09g044748 [Arachis hypogaea]